ncbi:MAG: Fe-S cluster assembly protein SufB [Candidatus Jacksonbacteria bacterium RIFCSPLOWO2_02_FULL_44_20]|uniref:Fe-S cluster assembly protein SufB n=1 Tax=Candidatus Jacksonbacteria bacterium RIFCSPLOWO2_02_FULL_44_20 TaxID=1798460 RepID=A0A1G2ADN5_9BACT|nr:MAG: Fe-S cluster assembly protein SufB [Candidatus Jacksonbacteria bacterium RIFCSPHIGHO2_02_FULL_44_25]OGY73387.1 MAG: Fe-S cluster assembly protein SufB [Candidatus Jacksonbacteria bacterium RIFCSPLOWO2_12_FULL_44_15b]OGY74137.1 MAG: Fe-S cluster assembly protein SufB [Candidatus Jacksonbacteria bacterium RIFCSPLOWO2_02_FULL_44_20]
MNKQKIASTTYKWGFHDKEAPVYKSPKGLSQKVVESISHYKSEPAWMRDFRLRALKIFFAKPLPSWGADLSAIDFNNIYYYIKPTEATMHSWNEVPDRIKATFDKLGIPAAEQKYLAGVGTQYDSENVYHNLRESLAKQGVIFSDVETALKEHPELVRKYFATVIPPGDNKFAALNSAVWSGGSFIYVPPGVHVEQPLQTYFRINAKNMGQFERTLIIVDEGAFVHYIEGCSAPIYATSSLHTAVVEIIALRGSRVRYTTVQNWSNDVYNLVTKRAFAHEDAVVEWVDFNMGCLAGSSKIYVYGKGVVDMKDVKIGDEVYSVNTDTLIPMKKKVAGVQDNGTRETYRLVTIDHREIVATDNHPFLTLESGGVGRSNRYLKWRPLKDLQEGDYIAVADSLPDDGSPYRIQFQYKPLKQAKYHIQIPTETNKELMWILGAYLGDGYFEYDKVKSIPRRLRRVYFAVPPHDNARQKLEIYLQKVFGIDFWRNKGICLTIGSSILAQFIHDLGFGGGARTKRVPQWVYTLPHKQQLAFIEGYLDTDGSERHKMVKDGIQYGQLTFTSCNKELLQDMKYVMISCGLKPLKISTYIASRKLTEGKEVKEYITHFLTLNIREDLEIIRNKCSKRENQIEFVKIREVVPDKKQKVYDLEVEGTHNFIANGIVVHNSKITMKYPAVYMVGRGARADILSMAYAGAGQHLDAGGKAVHLASDTSSRVISKSVSHGGGRTSYRGLLRVGKGARGVKSKVQCDALILDQASRSDTYPVMKIEEDDATIEHEATVSKIGEEQLFYLMSRGLTADEAALMIVNGFIEPLVKELPLEYAVEMNRMIALEMEGSVG